MAVHYNLSRFHDHTFLFLFTYFLIFVSKVLDKVQLLNWCCEVTKQFGVEVVNFTSSWTGYSYTHVANGLAFFSPFSLFFSLFFSSSQYSFTSDGRAFASLVSYLFPQSLSADCVREMKTENARENLELAFHKAEEMVSYFFQLFSTLSYPFPDFHFACFIHKFSIRLGNSSLFGG